MIRTYVRRNTTALCVRVVEIHSAATENILFFRSAVEAKTTTGI
jgi:hypothetical protein